MNNFKINILSKQEMVKSIKFLWKYLSLPCIVLLSAGCMEISTYGEPLGSQKRPKFPNTRGLYNFYEAAQFVDEIKNYTYRLNKDLESTPEEKFAKEYEEYTLKSFIGSFDGNNPLSGLLSYDEFLKIRKQTQNMDIHELNKFAQEAGEFKIAENGLQNNFFYFSAKAPKKKLELNRR